jgi:hypothetical protein
VCDVWEFKAICLWYTKGYKIVLHVNTFKDKKRKLSRDW